MNGYFKSSLLSHCYFIDQVKVEISHPLCLLIIILFSSNINHSVFLNKTLLDITFHIDLVNLNRQSKYLRNSI